MKFIVSATEFDSDVELPHTRQTVADEETAKRLVIARNFAEAKAGGRFAWGYYPAGSALDPQADALERAKLLHPNDGEIQTAPPYDC